MNVSGRRVLCVAVWLLLLAACEQAVGPVGPPVDTTPVDQPAPPEPEPYAPPAPKPTPVWVPQEPILVSVAEGTDEGPYVTDAEWLSIVEYADHAFSRSYIRVHVLPVATGDGTHITVRFQHEQGDETVDEPALASAHVTDSLIRFYMEHWPLAHDHLLIGMGNALAHEIVHILNIKCEHDPLDTPTLFGGGPVLTTDVYFSDATRACLGGTDG